MSKLSVDAAVFVPGVSTEALPPPESIAALPQYVTSCYPFVQGDPGLVRKRLASPGIVDGHPQGTPPNVFHPQPFAQASSGHVTPPFSPYPLYPLRPPIIFPGAGLPPVPGSGPPGAFTRGGVPGGHLRHSNPRLARANQSSNYKSQSSFSGYSIPRDHLLYPDLSNVQNNNYDLPRSRRPKSRTNTATKSKDNKTKTPNTLAKTSLVKAPLPVPISTTTTKTSVSEVSLTNNLLFKSSAINTEALALCPGILLNPDKKAKAKPKVEDVKPKAGYKDSYASVRIEGPILPYIIPMHPDDGIACTYINHNHTVTIATQMGEIRRLSTTTTTTATTSTSSRTTASASTKTTNTASTVTEPSASASATEPAVPRFSYAQMAKSTPRPPSPLATTNTAEPIVKTVEPVDPVTARDNFIEKEIIPNQVPASMKRRPRKRVRKHSKSLSENESAKEANAEATESEVDQYAEDMKLTDEQEFPGLSEAGPNAFNAMTSAPVLSYSMVLAGQQAPWSSWTLGQTSSNLQNGPAQLQEGEVLSQDAQLSLLSGLQVNAALEEALIARGGHSVSTRSGHTSNTSSTWSLENTGADGGASSGPSRAAKKRRSKREYAKLKADKELLEISLEHEVMKLGIKAKINEVKAKKRAKAKDPMPLNIAEMISALEKQQEKQNQSRSRSRSASRSGDERRKSRTHKDNNILVDKSVHNSTENNFKKPVLPDTELNAGLNALDSNPSLKRGKERENPKVKKCSSLKKVILKERENRRRRHWPDDCDISHASPLIVDSLAGRVSVDEDDLDESEDSAMAASGEISPVSQSSPYSMSPISTGSPLSPLSSEITSPIQPGFIHKSAAALSVHSRRFREYCNQVLDKDIDTYCVSLLQDLCRFQNKVHHKTPNKYKGKRRLILGLREVTKHLKLKKLKCVIISPNCERIQSKGGLDEALNLIISECQDQNVPFIFALGRRALGRACHKLVPVSVVGIFNYDGSEENYKKLIELTHRARKEYNKMVKELEIELDSNSSLSVPNPQNIQPRVYAHQGHSRTPSGCSGISFASSMMSEPISELGGDDVTRASATSATAHNLSVPNKAEYFKRAHLSHSRNSSLGQVSMVESITELEENCYEADIDEQDQSEEAQDSSTVIRRNSDVYIDDDDDEVDTIEELPNRQECSEHLQQDQLSTLSTYSGRTITATPLVTATSSEKSGDIDMATVAQRLKVIDQERIESWVEKAASTMQDIKLSDSETELIVNGVDS